MENTADNLQTQLQPLMSCNTKTCRKCGTVLSATTEFFYKQSVGKYGLTSRCKPCVNEDNKASLATRLFREPEKVRKQAAERQKRHYWKNLDKSRKKHRDHAAKIRENPLTSEDARKRGGGAGLSAKQIDEMFASQGECCAICGATEPGSKSGWNLDHCHKTKAVRFVLCAHCNRGLGAFKDNPTIMRKAADMIEQQR
jgi:hypothetical protein